MTQKANRFPETTHVTGYFNPQKFSIYIEISEINMKAVLAPNVYIRDRAGNNINDPIFEPYCHPKGLARATSEEPVPIRFLPRSPKRLDKLPAAVKGGIMKNAGLTRGQREMAESFLNSFADVEKMLKSRLGKKSDDRTGVGALITEYSQRNPFWAKAAIELQMLRQIRNVLAHQRSANAGYPVAVTSSTLTSLQKIHEHLAKPESVAVRYRRTVVTVSAADSLSAFLATAFEHGFSQLPVVDAGQFGGLITENEIVRWLGRRAKSGVAEVNLAAVPVGVVLEEKDPYLRGIHIFRFERIDACVEDVMGRFAAEPMLEAVLLTRSGDKSTSLEGIITQWDAARYSG